MKRCEVQDLKSQLLEKENPRKLHEVTKETMKLMADLK